MGIEANDISLVKFLKKFTFTGDPTPQGKTQIALIDFLKICSMLKLEMALESLRLSLK